MKATFVLPGGSRFPSGGPRMVFRYANALAEAGWSPTVVMPSALRSGTLSLRLLRRGRYWLWRVTRSYEPRSWIDLDERVNLQWLPDLDPHRAPAGDAVIATAVQTAEAVARWPAAAGTKFYFVQDLEAWDFPGGRAEASWALPLRKIAISRWLCDRIAAIGETSAYLPNGLDDKAFGLDRPIESRRAPVLLWPHHWLPKKGSVDVLGVLQTLTTKISDLDVHAFGTVPAPQTAGVNVTYHRNPPQQALRELYNRTTVMVAPSHSEGWGLPPCEALQCGCALAASDIGGHREFLRHNENALLHSPGDVPALAENILRLFSDEALRFRLAHQGVRDMAELRFDTSVERLKHILQQGSAQ